MTEIVVSSFSIRMYIEIKILLISNKEIVKCHTIYREIFASGNFGENDAWKVC